MGIRNTRNLCTKVDLVASGHAHDRLLDEYQAECYGPTKATIKEALRMGKVLFNTSAPANVVRNFVGNTLRRGKPIDITKAVAPAAMTLGTPHGMTSSLKRVLPQLRIEMPESGEKLLMTVGQERPKVLVANESSLDGVAALRDAPEAVRPDAYVAVQDFGNASDARQFQIVDDTQRTDLFGPDAYVVLAENNALIGRYAQGDEARMMADYRSVFHLRL